jgi:hypothetical protein
MGLLHHVPVELKNYNDFDIHQVLFFLNLYFMSCSIILALLTELNLVGLALFCCLVRAIVLFVLI